MNLTYRTLRGGDVEACLDDLAALRITVFRDWPYLYDGDHGYERDYMASYRDNPDAVLVGAFDGTRLVGAATGTPVEDHADDFARAFDNTGLAVSDIFYCAESVLLAAYRGQGAGHAFFDHREAHARALGRSYATFCAVQRPADHPPNHPANHPANHPVNHPADHPVRPADYRPLDTFWQKRGYSRMEGVTASFSWKDVGDTAQTDKTMQFWINAL